ncbi:hypothetical protein F4782DRAFT_543235 [Xylaria castorea]|nr:hypothetical protein F4782DRAFT_543235 [Xylaria castorea]
METHGSTSASPVSTDPLEMFDFIKYSATPYQSPSLSPTGANKSQFTPPTTAMTTTPATMPPNQVLCGPSHQYDAYKQQTPLVPGALANTLAINDGNVQMANYGLDYINPGEELYDFNSTPPQNSMTTPDMDIDFDSAEPTFFFPATPAVNSHSGNTAPTAVATQPGTVGRMYPGMHAQRAAMAKAQAHAQAQAEARAEQKLQHQVEMMRRQEQQRRHQQLKQSRPPKPSQPADPIVEQKITQLLNTMRSSITASEPDDDDEDSPMVQVPRLKKEQDEMDEDERLLASEEGKKLSSKERRQLRNKVSARAFRSRRKEYIGQLEAEVAGKVGENNDLRAENRVLIDENRRLTNLAHMLLSSAPFSSLLDSLSQDPAALLSQVQPQMERRQPEPTQVPKDPNPYNATPFGQQQQIGMAMMPEQSMDFSMLHSQGSTDYYQPRVFAVLETPELPEIDTDVLMGKSSNFVGEAPTSDNDKTDAPSLEAPVLSTIAKPQIPEVNSEPTSVEKKVSSLDGDIFDDDDDCPTLSLRPLELDTDGFSSVDIFGGIESEKAFARYELVDSSEEEKLASIALKRVERLAASLAATISGLERLDMDM